MTDIQGFEVQDNSPQQFANFLANYGEAFVYYYDAEYYYVNQPQTRRLSRLQETSHLLVLPGTVNQSG